MLAWHYIKLSSEIPKVLYEEEIPEYFNWEQQILHYFLQTLNALVPFTMAAIDISIGL